MTQRTKLIDAHAHVLDEKIYRDYRNKAGNAVDRIITLHNWTQPGDPRYALDEVIEFASKHKDVSVVGCVNMLHAIGLQLNLLDHHLFNGEIVGIKMYPGYQHFYPSDSFVDEVAKLCGSHDAPLIFHTGDCADRGNPLVKYSHPLHVDELATKNPETTIVIAHLGFPYLMEAAMIVSKHKNVYADISGTIDRMHGPNAELRRRRIVEAYKNDLRRVLAYYPGLEDKLMFGTDYGGEHSNLNDVESYIEVLDLICDDEEMRAKIGHGNAAHVFSLPALP